MGTSTTFHSQMILNSKVLLVRFLGVLAHVTVGGPSLRCVLQNIEDELQLAGGETLVLRVTLHHGH